MASAKEVGRALARMDDPGAGRNSGSDHGARFGGRGGHLFGLGQRV